MITACESVFDQLSLIRQRSNRSSVTWITACEVTSSVSSCATQTMFQSLFRYTVSSVHTHNISIALPLRCLQRSNRSSFILLTTFQSLFRHTASNVPIALPLHCLQRSNRSSVTLVTTSHSLYCTTVQSLSARGRMRANRIHSTCVYVCFLRDRRMSSIHRAFPSSNKIPTAHPCTRP